MTGISERESLLLRGTLDMCVLLLLAEQPRHAYAVVQDLQDLGFQTTSYGTIYPLVTRLRRQGLVKQKSQAGEGGPARNVLSCTEQGRAALTDWAAQWREVNERINKLMEQVDA